MSAATLTDDQIVEQFCAAMREHEIDVSFADIVPDGRFHRIHVEGDRKGVKNGWYVLHVDGARPAGAFGCNRRYGNTTKFTWSAEKSAKPLTPAERRAFRDEMNRRRREREATEQAQRDAALALANEIWNRAHDATDHPYLKRKGIRAHGLRVGVWEKVNPETGEVRIISKNALLVPIRDAKKQIHSLQAIFPNDKNALGRDKDYLSHGEKRGLFYSIGKPLEHDGRAVILICEGYATGASLHECTGHAVIVAFDAGNLSAVAKVIRSRFPDAIIVMAADNDRWTTKPIDNPGVVRAREAAAEIGGLVAVPDLKDLNGNPTDFNDLHVREGAEAVRAIIDDALAETGRVLPVWFVPKCSPAELERIQFAADGIVTFNPELAARLSRRGVLIAEYNAAEDLHATLDNVRRFMPSASAQVFAAPGLEREISAVAQAAGASIRLPEAGVSWVGWTDALWANLCAVTGSKVLRTQSHAAEPVNDAPATRVTAGQASARQAARDSVAAEDLPPERAVVAELNEQHAVVIAGDKAVVLRECPSDMPGHGIEIRLLSAFSFKLFHCNRTIDIEFRNEDGETRRKTVPIADWWLKSPERRTYGGITFAPGADAPSGYYNLWHGHAVEPRRGSLFSNAMKCRRLLRHMKLNVCQANREHFRYLLAWAADMLQDPSRKKGVALVLRGNKGSGKSKIAEVFSSLLGQHAIKISQMKHLVGNFNRHLANKLLVVAEESFWAGDKADDGPLKDMITSPTITLEAKGVDAFEIRSFSRIMMITNNAWAVPATSDERRYFVLDVGDEKRGDHDYFASIDEQLDRNNHEGRRAFLAFLLAFDLSGLNLRKVPETSALRDQRMLSLEPHDQFIYDALIDKRLAGTDWEWTHEIPKQQVYDAYIESAKKRGKSHLKPYAQLCDHFMSRVGATPVRLRNGINRVQAFRLPEWRVAAARFEDAMGIDILGVCERQGEEVSDSF